MLTVKACWVKCFTMRVICGLLMVSLNDLNCGLVVNKRIKKQSLTYIHSFFTGICSSLMLFLFTWALSSWTTVLKAIRPDFSPRWHSSFSLLSESCTFTSFLSHSGNFPYASLYRLIIHAVQQLHLICNHSKQYIWSNPFLIKYTWAVMLINHNRSYVYWHYLAMLISVVCTV